MINSFKFFWGPSRSFVELMNEIDSSEEYLPSWSWAEELLHSNDDRYDVVTEEHDGIWEFLMRFPHDTVVPIISILGPNGTLHSENSNLSNGWGFDIDEDRLIITYYKLRGILGEE